MENEIESATERLNITINEPREQVGEGSDSKREMRSLEEAGMKGEEVLNPQVPPIESY